jgi:glycosyltransferase involved in cell wall biosynthesis
MKLLAVIEAASVTGPAKNLIDFARAARELPRDARIETAVVTFEREGSNAPNPFLDALREAGIPVRCVRQRSAADRSALDGLRAAFEEFAPDILQTHAVKSHFLMRLSGLSKRRPWVAFHHGYTTPDLKMRFYNQLDRWSLRAPARIATVSRAFEQQLRDTGVPAGRITVLHNAIDPHWMVGALDREAARSRLGIGKEERVVATVGRLSSEKAHVDLVRAVVKLDELDHDLPVRVVIAGEGPERSSIERLARELGISERVTLTGFLADSRPVYAAADVIALSSLSEGSPNALLEAMAAGVPVVATAVGGIPEIVTNEETALLVAPRSPEALAAAIRRVFAEPEASRARADRAGIIVASRYSPSERVRKLAELYREVAAHARRD